MNAVSTAPAKLLHTKLMPPRPHAAVIPRSDLLARLDAALESKLILVSVPTGYGKTTLVSMWLAGRPFPSAWVNLDGNDNDPTRFWTYFVSALRSFDGAPGKTTLSALAAPQPAPFQTWLPALMDELASLKEPCVLVLDEWQAIVSPAIHHDLAFLIQNLPAPLHLVLVSRSEPGLPLGLLRARDELVEFVTADLQFSPAETQAFLNELLPASLPPALVALLQARTEGWPAGLRLAALALQNKDPQEFEKTIQSFSGSHRYVSDYLIGEVFAAQPDPVQEFLLKTCMLNRLTPSLCDALMDSHTTAATLAELERLNLFIVRLEHTGDQTWYRYAPLFAELVQFLARQRLGEEALKAVFEKASVWYEYHGLVDEAIENALAAKAYDRTMQLIEKFIAIHDLSEMQTLGRWLENIPLPEILQHALICFTFAQITLYTSDRFAPATAASLEPYLAAAEFDLACARGPGAPGAVALFPRHRDLVAGGYPESARIRPPVARSPSGIGCALARQQPIDRRPGGLDRRAGAGGAGQPAGSPGALRRSSKQFWGLGSHADIKRSFLLAGRTGTGRTARPADPVGCGGG